MFKKKQIILFFLFLLFMNWGLRSQDKPLCKQSANYDIDVQLDPSDHTLSATEILTWTNDTSEATDELWFHLYWNVFQNNKSTLIQEGYRRRRVGRALNFKKDDWGYCEVDSIEILKNSFCEKKNITPTIKFRHPDDENSYDQTVISVDLPYPIEPGENITLKINFHSKIPRSIRRTGVYKNDYFIAQWFPKIGVFEGDGWNCHQYHASTEFFADYGTYDVQITVPSSFVVGATGEQRQKINNKDGTTTYQFHQHSVHDFAWTANPNFLKYVEDYEFVPGKTTEITLLLQSQHKHLKEVFMNAIENALTYCSLRYGNYPYTTVTCVNSAYNSGTGNMEYPTFFTSTAYFLNPKNTARPEYVIIHEFGHGYFYGLVGSNEFENAWMDEGFTSFLDTEIYYEAYGEPAYSKRYFGIPVVFNKARMPKELDQSQSISRHRKTYNNDIMQRYAWKFMDNTGGAQSYSKGELMLRTLKRFMGEETFSQMIKAYSQRHWFKHPKPEDFYEVVSEFAGKDMSWFLDQFIYGSEKLDYAVGNVKNQKIPPLRGWFNGEYKEKGNQPKNNLYQSEVLVRRLGGVKLPVDILIVFTDGQKLKETWDGQYRWKKFTYKSPEKIKKVIVDPEFNFVIDINRTNIGFLGI